MKKNQATNSGTTGSTRKPGVIGRNSRSTGSVSRTNAFMKKKSESIGRKRFIAARPISVHMTMPSA